MRVTAIETQVDGQAVGGTGTGSPFSVSVDTTQYASGQHVLRTRARDAAGNTSAWVSNTVNFGGGRTQPAGFTRNDSWITGLTSATAFAQAPDGRIFVTEQGGAVRVVKNGTLLTTPFIQLADVAAPANTERGLLGIAFHPEFGTDPNKRWVYLYYTTDVSGTHNRIIRVTASPANADVWSVGSTVSIADLPALSATNHNGGAIHFGTDGKLYVGVGDNANGANAPSLGTRLGKMLRLNDDGSIPTDNPFFGSTTGDNRSIWAIGLRNPFTFAVRPSDGRIHINDVGETTWEEINVGAAGANYGWSGGNTDGPTTAAGITAPLFAYRHSATTPPGSGPGGFFTGCAIIGGAFYPNTGPFAAMYRGSYFFSDLCTPTIGRLDLTNNAAYAFGAVGSGPVGMLVGQDGALYVLKQGGITRFTAP